MEILQFGALPALETLSALTIPVREIRGIVNGTCGVILESWSLEA
jgi:homoserine dehydrogenase